METSFLELKCKQVINTVDGKCLGHITDIIFDVGSACTLGFVVPQPGEGFWGLFRNNRELFIPFNCVCKIGVDVVLVELYINDKPYDCHKSKHCIDKKYLIQDNDKKYNAEKR